jgi:hypothetical protein
MVYLAFELCGVRVDGGSSIEKRMGHELEAVVVLGFMWMVGRVYNRKWDMNVRLWQC